MHPSMTHLSRSDMWKKFEKIFGFKPQLSMGTLDVVWLDDKMKTLGYPGSGTSLKQYIVDRYGKEAGHLCVAMMEL